MKSICTQFKIALVLAAMASCCGQVWAQTDIQSFSSFANQNRSVFQPLTQEQAFPLRVSEFETGHFRVTWDIATEHYLYKRAFKVSLRDDDTEQTTPLAFQLPQGIDKHDEFFGDVEVYYLQLKVDFLLTSSPPDNASLIIEYQGCAEWGFCYPPQEFSFKLL